MSKQEVKTNEEVKQEGDFKLKAKPKKPKQLSKEDNVVKVDLKKVDTSLKGNNKVEEPIKVDLTETKKQEDDAIQIGETKELSDDKRTGDLQQVEKEVRGGDSEDKQVSQPESAVKSEENPIVEVEKENVEKEVKPQPKPQQEVVQEKTIEKVLPENIEKLVSFMEETGGTVEDYVTLNKDYAKLNSAELLNEYYKKTKPHLDQEEISFLMEDAFNFDEEVDEAREVRKKKLAYKEEVAKAKVFLESSKQKYYDEIKLRPSESAEQKEALSFYDRYKEQQKLAETQHGDFRDHTKKLFSKDFKGFDFQVGEKLFRYGVKDPVKVGETQADVQNFVGKYLDDKGFVTDASGYHKAMYAAMNADKIAHHFYEQGKADGIKDVIQTSKNPSTDKPRQVADGNVFINGLKVKSISGLDSTKLKIKKRKFN